MIFLSDWAFSDATQNTYNLSFTKPNHPNRAAWSDSSDRAIHVVNVSPNSSSNDGFAYIYDNCLRFYGYI